MLKFVAKMSFSFYIFKEKAFMTIWGLYSRSKECVSLTYGKYDRAQTAKDQFKNQVIESETMGKKILFLISPSIRADEYKNVDRNSVWNQITPPYGPLSMIAYVKSYLSTNVGFRILDLRQLYYSQESDDIGKNLISKIIKESIKDFEPDFIAISALFNTCYTHMECIVNAIQTCTQPKITIIGGGLATVAYEELLTDFPLIDLAIISEGELPLLNLLKSENPMDSYHGNSAIVTRKSLKEDIVPRPQFIKDLDKIPYLDFSYLNMSLYPSNTVNMVTSRGCPYNCVFCAAHLMSGKKIRFHSSGRVNRDFEEYYNRGYRQFNIFDDNFFFNTQRAKEILTKLIELNLNNELSINFPSGVMVAHIHPDIAYLLSKLNVEELSLALESGSERVLKKIIRKPVTKDQFETAVKALRCNNIRVRSFIVTGLPGETDEDRQDTVDYLKKIGVDWASINIAIPLYGSRLYKICEEKIFERGT